MAYERNQWASGDTITSSKLNTMEDGIASATDTAEAAAEAAAANKATLDQQTAKDAEHDAAIQEGQVKDESQDTSIAANAEAIANLQQQDTTTGEALNTLTESVCTLQENVLDLTGRVTALETDDPNTPEAVTREEFNGLSEKVTTVETTAGEAKAAAEQNAGAIDTLSQSVTGMGVQVTSVTGMATQTASDVTELTGRVDAVEATAGTLTENDATQDAAIESLISLTASQGEDITALQAADKTINSTVGDVQSAMTTLNETVQSHAAAIAELQGHENEPVQHPITTEEIVEIKNRISANETNITALQEADTATDEEIATLNKTVSTQSESLNTLEGTVSTLNENIQSLSSGMTQAAQQLQTQITANAEAITALQSKDTEIESSVSSVSGTVDTLNTTVSELNTEVTELTATVSTVSGKADANEEAVATLQESVSTLSDASEEATTNISDLTERVTTAEDTLTTQGETLSTLEGTVNGNSSSLSTLSGTVSTLNETVQSHAAAIAELQGHAGEPVQHPITTEEVVEIKGRITANESAITALQSKDTELESADEALGTRVTALEALPDQISTINGTLSTLGSKDTELEGLISAQSALIAELQEQVYELTPATEVTLDTSNATVDMTGKKVAITLGSDMPDTVSVKARDVTVESPTTESQIVAIQGTDSITISNPTSSGSLGANSVAWQLNTNGEVVVDGGTLAQAGYNAFNISLNSGYAVKKVHVKDVEFTGTLTNNAVSVYRVEDNAEILIENCHFTSVSNLFRFSNATNATGITITLKNCKVDAWESRLNYAGLVIFQDYTSTAGNWQENNLFASDKITLNIIDCTGPNGPIMPAEPSAVYATHDTNQLAYVYVDKGGASAELPYSGNESRFPTLNIQNSTAEG